MESDGSFLHGVRVLDFTVNAAGPNAAWLLGSLGAEVIKVESHTRPDPSRGIRDRPYLHGIFYEDANAGKRSITLDMKSSAAQRLALELAGRCDAVVDSFRPGVMDRLGLGFDAVHEKFPHVVVASLSATGAVGPLAGLPGYAGVFNALGGMGGLTGYHSGPPTELRSSIDLRAGAMYAMCIAFAINTAKRTGVGSRVDFSAVEAVALLCGEYLTGALLAGPAVTQRIGDRDEQWSPHGVYPTADAAWIAIGVRDDAEWGALAHLFEADGLDVPEYLAGTKARLDAASAADDLVAGWTSQHPVVELLTKLRDARVPAAAAHDGRDLYHDEQLRGTGFYQSVEDLATGTEQLAASAPWLVNGHRPAVGEPRRLGADNNAVLAELLGLSEDEIARIEAEGTLSRPVAVGSEAR